MTTIKEYKALMEGTTDGPWGVTNHPNQKAYGGNLIVTPRDTDMVVCTVWTCDEDDETASNGKFIAASRNIAPELIRVIELAEVALNKAHNALDHADVPFHPSAIIATREALSEIRKLKGE